MKMNSKESSWRCPLCKLSAGRTDLHVDPKFSKVLRESRQDVLSVIVSEDDLWKPILAKKDDFKKDLWYDIFQNISSSLCRSPTIPTCSSSQRGNSKPKNSPSSKILEPVNLQHHSANQRMPCQSAQQRFDIPNHRPYLTTTSKRQKAAAAMPAELEDNRVGRMRGSLRGEAYSAALSQFMSPPIQPASQAASFPLPILSPHQPHVHGPPPSGGTNT